MTSVNKLTSLIPPGRKALRRSSPPMATMRLGLGSFKLAFGGVVALQMTRHEGIVVPGTLYPTQPTPLIRKKRV